MASDLPQRVFITGTDTAVGKTVTAAVLVAGLRAEYWKPIQSGLEEITDTEWIRQKTGMPKELFHPETYRLQRPLSPHASARAEGARIDLEAFHLPPRSSRRLVVEGAGGLMVPLNERDFMIDLMKKLDLPTILVAGSRLGTINHTLLSLEQLRRYDLEILGVVLNGPKNAGNKEAIEYYGDVAILAEIEPLETIDPAGLKRVFKRCFILTS
jgi:dethiobiotin synthetase